MPALIFLAYGSLFTLSLLDNIRSPYFPDLLQALQLNGTKGALYFSVTSLFAFIGSWSSHRLIQYRSSLFLLQVSSVIVALGFAAISRANNLSTLLMCCAFFGFGYGSINLAQNLIVVEASPIHLRRQIFSGLHSMYGLAALVAPLVSSLFRWMEWGWRQGFFSLACLALILPFVSLFFKAPRRDLNLAHEHKVAPMNRAEWKVCIIFALMMAGYLWGEIGISTRMVLWLRTELGYAPDLANFYLAGFFVMLLSGRILFSFKGFSGFDNWRILKLSAIGSAITFSLGLWLSPMWFCLCGLMMAPFFPVAMELVSEIFRGKSAQALGFVLGFGSLSVVLLHSVLGVLSDLFGVSHALIAAPITLGIIGLGLYVRERKVLLQSR